MTRQTVPIMAVSLFVGASRRLQAPVAALLILAGLQLAAAALEPRSPAAVTSVHAALAQTASPVIAR